MGTAAMLTSTANIAHVGTAAQACPERSRRGCPVERSSTGLGHHRHTEANPFPNHKRQRLFNSL